MLLTEPHIQKEFEFIDFDKDGYIGTSDMEKFMLSFTDPENLELDEAS